MSDTWTITARWVFPVEQAPLERGTVTIEGDRLAAVEPHGGRTADVDVGNAALVPGFVNAHTHLDLSGLRGQTPPSPDFTGWLRAVIGHRRSQSPGQVQEDIRRGIAESLACGTTLVGDIAAAGASWPLLAAAPLRAVVFYELLGLPRPRARQAWQEARSWYQAHPRTPTCRPGLGPHAPYSVRASLLRTASSFARKHRLPLAIHLAETTGELELLRARQGPLVDFLQNLGVWDPTGLVGSLEEIWRIAQDIEEVLIAHGNYLDYSQPVPRSAAIVYCPRTQAAFGHLEHPLLRGGQPGALDRVRVALGTDSLASNPDLSVLEEARFLFRKYPHIGGARLLRMATLSGAEALGRHAETGSLAVGKSADLAVVPLPAVDNADPHQLLLNSSLPVHKVLFRGAWLDTHP
jgi:cytosine/adenosine deaminase-related metal-dependent hydrolase